MKNSENYQGWSNYETWNIALYINNDFKLYQSAQNSGSYEDFLERAMIDDRSTTPDGVRWGSKRINRDELNKKLFGNK